MGTPRKSKADPLKIPPFLVRKLDRSPERQAFISNLVTPAIKHWAPIRPYVPESKGPPPALYVTDPSAQVTVVAREKTGPRTIATYPNLAAFESGHNFGEYPFKRCLSAKDGNFVEVSAKPWAGREKVVKVPGEAKSKINSKVNLIGDLMLRPEGCTTKDVLAATGWPAVSMPAQAKLAGLTLRKEKDPKTKVTTYWGTKI